MILSVYSSSLAEPKGKLFSGAKKKKWCNLECVSFSFIALFQFSISCTHRGRGVKPQNSIADVR